MTTYGFHASHEQFTPRALLDALRAAESSGFTSGMCSDHFAPWSSRQGHSGHAWTWLGAALEATSLPMGVVTSPGVRYHPAVLAQAAGTLAQMYPGRCWVALGTGQALNERVTGAHWPPKPERMRRLTASVEIMRALFAGETVTRQEPVRVEHGRLWTRPDQPPALIGAAVTPRTAGEIAGWADGLITINQPGHAQRDTLAAYRNAGGRGPSLLQVHLSWDRSREAALAAAHDQWKEAALGSDVGWEIARPDHFEQAARFVSPGDVEPYVHVSADLAEHADWLAGAAEGFDRVMLHQVGPGQVEFVEAFGEHVLPEVTS
ncbi:TIGR03885 family FMN-dependent LLM class oxidoreductase [Streptomyces sodiiphilus]|uniref:TIGR03885 family FMN-dependent LLM class oxidoreductase n=1 Tax=Streptomyces sodiiphilus TaxID=226217 RepID=A0ABN2P215_9ACTN